MRQRLFELQALQAGERVTMHRVLWRRRAAALLSVLPVLVAAHLPRRLASAAHLLLPALELKHQNIQTTSRAAAQAAMWD